MPQSGMGKAFSLSVLLDKCHAHFLNLMRKIGGLKPSYYREKAESLKYHSPGHRPGSIDSPNQIAGCRPATGIIAS